MNLNHAERKQLGVLRSADPNKGMYGPVAARAASLWTTRILNRLVEMGLAESKYEGEGWPDDGAISTETRLLLDGKYYRPTAEGYRVPID